MKTVILNDNKLNFLDAHIVFQEAAEWATANCTSFKGATVIDVSDTSYSYDLAAEYKFKDDKDATMFRLKWL